MTIPALITNYKKDVYAKGFAKGYNTISNIQNLTQGEFSNPTNWEWNLGAEYIVENYFLKKMNIIKNCKFSPGCFAQEGYKDITGKFWENVDTIGSNYKIKLADGSSLSFSITSNCISAKRRCMYIIYDINSEKGPNMSGRDLFIFYFYPFTNELMPEGIYQADGVYDTTTNLWPRNTEEMINSNCSKKDGVTITGSAPGNMCGAKIINEGWKMNY